MYSSYTRFGACRAGVMVSILELDSIRRWKRDLLLGPSRGPASICVLNSCKLPSLLVPGALILCVCRIVHRDAMLCTAPVKIPEMALAWRWKQSKPMRTCEPGVVQESAGCLMWMQCYMQLHKFHDAWRWDSRNKANRCVTAVAQDVSCGCRTTCDTARLRCCN